MKNPTICVDFDGVIHSYKSGWKGAHVIPDPPVPGAIEWLTDHLPMPEAICAMAPPYEGPVACIYSSRSKSWRGRRAMKKWLIEWGLHPAYISEGLLKFPVKKPGAFLTIDDRAICFDGTFPTNEEMLAFKPWNRSPDPQSTHAALVASIGGISGLSRPSRVAAMCGDHEEKSWPEPLESDYPFTFGEMRDCYRRYMMGETLPPREQRIANVRVAAARSMSQEAEDALTLAYHLETIVTARNLARFADNWPLVSRLDHLERYLGGAQ